ncbi:hypothetical protein GQ457_06G025380 [Hibiscus cannabinus]
MLVLRSSQIVLKLNGCKKLEELPKKIGNLVNLTHLPCDECWSLTHMPRGIGKLTSLQTLSLFVVDKHGSHGGAAAGLSELGGLNNLRGELTIRNLGWVKNAKEEFRAANLKEKQHLHSLILEWSDHVPKDDDEDDEEKSLEDLQPHPNLKELRVVGWRGDAKVLSWLSLLTNLTEVGIMFLSRLKHLPSFAQLPYLRRLFILDLPELEYMEDSDPSGGQGESESFFPSLTSLILMECPNMKSWWRERPIDDDNGTEIRTSTMAFPCLSSLHIEDCPLTSMPLYPSLDDELRLVNTSSRPLKQTIQMSLSLSRLESFHVENIEEMDPNMLDECLHNKISLKHWGIASCHWLKSLSGCLQQLTSLKTLSLSDCKELDLEGMSWEPLKNLSDLKIDNIPQLASLPLWLQHLVQLKSLVIKNCSGLRSLFPVFQHLTSLEAFEAINCKELELSAVGIQIFQDYTSLRDLRLENIPKCRHLPEWLQHLTNLKNLDLNDFPNLTSLPDEMRYLTTLQVLNMYMIPELEERCLKDIGADWHKIAHIPEIWVNWVVFEEFICRKRGGNWFIVFVHMELMRSTSFTRTGVDRVHFQHILRAKNQLADYLAKAGVQRDSFFKAWW